MDTELIEHLKQRYGFAQWKHHRKSSEYSLVWNFFFSGNEIAGCTAHNIREINTFGKPRCIRSTWERKGGDDELFNVDVFECASHSEAAQTVMVQLSHFESADVKRIEGNPIGDVLFTTPLGGAIVFVRGNLVVSVSKAGRGEIPIQQIAADLDRYFGTEPPPSLPTMRQPGPSPHISVGNAVAANKTPLKIERHPTAEARSWHRFSSETGEIVLENGHPVYIGGTSPTHAVRVRTTNAVGQANVQVLEIPAAQ